MKKYLSLLMGLILVYSVSTFAKATYSFESEDEALLFVPNPGTAYFTIYERTDAMAYDGDYSMMYVLDDTSAEGTGGEKWEIRSSDPDLLSGLEFMVDTIFFWMYLPDVGEGVMNWVQPFTQDAQWRWHGAYQSYSSASLDQWACYPVHIDTLMWDGSTKRELPINRAGVEFGATNYEPGCTVYIDLVSSVSREGGSGIELITDPAKIILEASINTIKFSLAEPTPVLLSVYNLLGAKMAEIAPGGMNAGPHEVSVNLPNGMYIVKIVAGQVKDSKRLLVIK
jgi:hypothetical protein